MENVKAAIKAWDDALGGNIKLNVTVSMSTGLKADRISAGDGSYLDLGTRDGIKNYENNVTQALRTGYYYPTQNAADIYFRINPSYLNSMHFDANPYDADTYVPAGKIDFYSLVLRDMAGLLGFRNSWSLTTNLSPSWKYSSDYLLLKIGDKQYYSGENINNYNAGPLEIANGSYNDVSYYNAKPIPKTSVMSGNLETGTRYSITSVDLAVMADQGIGTRQSDILKLHLDSTGRSVRLDADAGTDTAVYQGNRSDYTVKYSAKDGGFIVTGKGYTDTLISVEALRFNDGKVWIEDAANLTSGVHRFYNTATGLHFYTGANSEAYSLRETQVQMVDEGLVFTNSNGAGALDVHRFQNKVTGAYFYTINNQEKDNIIKNLPQFVYQGSSFKALTTDIGPQEELYRFYNTQTQSHFFTTSEAERDSVIANLPQFKYEGIAFYVDILT
jgi:hypothetical protein